MHKAAAGMPKRQPRRECRSRQPEGQLHTHQPRSECRSCQPKWQRHARKATPRPQGNTTQVSPAGNQTTNYRIKSSEGFNNSNPSIRNRTRSKRNVFSSSESKTITNFRLLRKRSIRLLPESVGVSEIITSQREKKSIALSSFNCSSSSTNQRLPLRQISCDGLVCCCCW